jgi:chemotaxis protein histidine kinase CheA
MKKFTNLLIVCLLALAGAVMAQQPTSEESQPPGKKPDKKAPAEVKPRAPHAPKADAPAVAPKTEAPVRAPKTEAPAVKEPAAPSKMEKPEKKAPSSRKPAPAATAPTKTEQPAAIATPAAEKQQPPHSKKEMKKAPAADTAPGAPPAAPKTVATPAAAKTMPATPAAPNTTAAPAAATASPPPAAPASASAAPSVAQTSPATAPVNPAAAKKPDPQKVEQIKTQHQNFKAQPKPDKVPAVTFSANFRIQGSDRWQGPQYEVYRSYHPERHDRGWYHSRYKRVELISGGYYYWNSGYWYPAWGYSPTEEYYAYDAPIYVGQHAEPPDKVIADVQAVLQEMGYYKGEVDGLLGPLTREALTGYQADQGLTATAVIDEPTLNSLGMG